MQKLAIVSIALLATLICRPVAFAQQGAAGQARGATPERPGLEVPLVTPGARVEGLPALRERGLQDRGPQESQRR